MFLALFTLVAASCATTGTDKGVVRQCGPTPVMAKDMETFGFTPPKGKILVTRVFSSWCPYCQEDLVEMGSRFKKGEWKPENVHLLLMMYKNRKENKNTYLSFIRDTFPNYGIPLSAAQIVYVDKDYAELIKMKSASKQVLFEGWQGVPFALIFGKDGRLAYRGHFTQSPPMQDRHYDLITGLAKENCGG